MINIKDFDSSLLKKDKKLYKNIGIYHIGIYHITIKKIDVYENIHSVNPVYLIIGEVNGYIKKSNKNKYLAFAFTNKTKEVLTKYTKLWYEIKYLIIRK